MRLPTSIVAAAAALTLTAATGHAYGLKPGWRAQSQFVYGNGWAHYVAGCAHWMPFQRSWYNVCGPHVVAQPVGAAVISAKY